MAPLWKTMLSRSSPLYRDALFSFSLWEWKAQERELQQLKKQTDQERRAMLTQLHKLSKELQQKDKVIESLQAKLDQHHHHHHRSDSPSSSHALSDITDQSDRISYVSDEHGSTNGDPELCCDADAAGGPEENGNATGPASPLGAASRHPSVGSSQHSQSCLSCPSMHCSGSPLRPADLQSQSAPCRPPLSSPIKHGGRSQRSAAPAFSLAAVQQELQTLQKQLRADGRFSTPRSLHGLPRFVPQHHADAAGFPPLSYQGFPPPLFSGLDVAMATRAGAGLLERGASWETPCGAGADLSSRSSGYQSGTGHTGSDLMKEHLAEIRSLRRRLEESIQTNDRLRLQLEDRLACSAGDKGAPTNIYIQGLDSAGQLSAELRLLQEENAALQAQLQRAGREGSREAELRREAEHLREAVLKERSMLKEAELEIQRWAELSQRLQAEDAVRCQEVAQLRQDRQRNQETINRLQHEASVLRLQLDQSRSLSQTLQEALQDAKRRVWENSRDSHSDEAANGALPVTFDPRELHIQLKQQLSSQPAARRRLFSGEDVSPPVRDSGPIRDSGPVAAPPRLPPAACAQQGGASEGSHHAVGHLGDLQALQQQLLDGAALAGQMEAALCSLNASQRLHQPLDRGCVGNLLSDSKTLKRILQEAESLLQATWTAGLTHSEEARQIQTELLRCAGRVAEGRVAEGRGRLSPDEALRAGPGSKGRHGEAKELQPHQGQHGAFHRQPAIENAGRPEESQVQPAGEQTQDLLPSSLFLCPLSPLRPSKGENPGGATELGSPAGWSILTPWGLAAHQRPLQPGGPAPRCG